MSTITPVFNEHWKANLLVGDKQEIGPRGVVVAAENYRITMSLIVPAEPSDIRADFEENLKPEHRRPGPYGVALLEAQEIDVVAVTTAEAITAFQTGNFKLDATVFYQGWPYRGFGPWEGIYPETTWFPGGEGILSEIPNASGGTVTLFEYTVDSGLAYNKHGTPTGELVNMVGWHCDHCHTPYDFDLGEQWENKGPYMRRWAAQHARMHARGKAEHCKVPDGEIERVVSEVATKMHGRKIELPARAAACAAEDGCAKVRRAKAITARLVAEAAAA